MYIRLIIDIACIVWYSIFMDKSDDLTDKDGTTYDLGYIYSLQ